MTIELYPFQQQEAAKYAKQKAALCGDEMGCGKTHIAIEVDQVWEAQIYRETRKHLPTLVIAPINTFPSWVAKYEMQVPEIDVEVIDRKHRDKIVAAIKLNKADVYIVHWEALRLLVPEFEKYHVEFGTVIADEVHRASNRKAQATRALKKIKCHRKLAMSGTASGDKPENLWSILNWLWPTYYRSYWKFRNHYCVEETIHRGEGSYRQITGVKNIPALKREMSPWYTRHLKKEQCCPDHPNGVMEQLPEKTYDIIWVDLTPQQRRVYDQMKKEMVAWVGEHESSPLVASVVVAQMARLSQIALATPVVSEELKRGRDGSEELRLTVDLAAPSSKIDAVRELLDDNPDESFVVFTSSKKAAYLAAEVWGGKGISAEVLSGDTPDTQRRTLVQRFADREFRVFIAVIAAAAEGIDGLQGICSTAIFLDRSWSTIKNMQAEDRLHRDGQRDAVTIIDVMARNTLDFGRKQKLETKWSWIKSILGDDAQDKVLKGMI